MMVESMQGAFKESLEFIQWMSPQSADAAKAKLEHMADLIGYPAFVLNDTWLNKGKFLSKFSYFSPPVEICIDFAIL